MGNKTKRPKGTTTAPHELVDIAIAQEERWAYERRVERLTYRAMSDLSGEPLTAGGLGRTVSTATLVRRANAYRKSLILDERETRDEHRGRELEALDRQERALYTFLDPVDQAASAAVARQLDMSLDDLARIKPALLVPREDKVRIAALAQLRAVSESRRKLLGLDAPTESSLTVTTVDATDKALADLAAQLGKTPTPERQP
jgi:hypothetical protein